MIIAVILAGGIGSRTEQDVPKQFLNVYDKPIIIYTLEAFEKHPEIDAILVVCLTGWSEILWAYSRQYGIEKLRWIVDGGNNGQESTTKGIVQLDGICKEDDIVLVHDAIRPMVSQEIISDCIAKCKLYGSGLSAVRCQETIVKSMDAVKGKDIIARDQIMRVQTPQAYLYGKALWACRQAEKLHITNEVYLNTLMIHLGEELYFAMGSNKNIKITTLDDLDMFKALYRTRHEEWMK